MRKYETHKNVVKEETVCVLLKCDLCGKEAKRPKDGYPYSAFDTDDGFSGGACVTARYYVEGEGSLGEEECELCYECGLRVIKAIECKTIGMR